jgi:hypothetical protein
MLQATAGSAGRAPTTLTWSASVAKAGLPPRLHPLGHHLPMKLRLPLGHLPLKLPVVAFWYPPPTYQALGEGLAKAQ